MSLTAYHAGLSAEKAVASKYTRCGFKIVAERFKSPEGEIDVIARHNLQAVFC